MGHSNTVAASLLVDNLALFESLHLDMGILDLACGSGRNGLFLAKNKIPVTFADNNKVALETLRLQLQESGLPGVCWQVDLERGEDTLLADRRFDGIIVFNYLHRPLIAMLKEAIRPGGVVFYETFTVAQREFGRPNNPDFLLQPGELSDYFRDWQLMHYFEGVVAEPNRAIAQLIGKKPE